MEEKNVSYPAIFKKVEKDVYFVKFPDVDGAFTEGHGLRYTFEMASDVLATMLYDSKKLPKVVTLQAIICKMVSLSQSFKLTWLKLLTILRKQLEKMLLSLIA